MRLHNVAALWLSTLFIPTLVAAYSSLAGVNHYFLPYLPPGTGDGQRENVIQTLVNRGVRVIRVFIRASTSSPKGAPFVNVADAEGPSLRQYNDANLNIIDDFLGSVYRISGGQTKVIISPGNANDVKANYDFCDVYCNAVGGKANWLQFYSRSDIRQAYKDRLTYFFNTYKSRSFSGRSWSQLSEVILGVDVQNEPWVSLSSTPNSDWLCDIASHMKNNVGLGAHNIAVITGGIRGANSAGGSENWPDFAFACSTVDVIALHGYFGSQPVDQPWYDLLIQKQYGGVLRQKALDSGKLIMVEEWSYSASDAADSNRKNGDIWAQGHALNVRGIPWTYWDVMEGNEQCSGCEPKEVNVYGGSQSAMDTLSGMVNEAYNASTEFDWGRFYPKMNPYTVNLVQTSNPYPSTSGSSCTWGCVGWSCSSSQPCQGQNECVNGVCKACSWGCEGWNCNTNSPCKDVNQCVSGVCKPCNWGCQGWKCDANTPCQGQNECISGTCKKCTWGCLGWSCSSSQPCKTVNQCTNGVCKPCQWGCPGWSCSSSQPCSGDGECRSGVCGKCTWGCLGWSCSSSSPCKGENECVSGTCKPCSWGCQGWSCSASQPCKGIYQCASGVCKPK